MAKVKYYAKENSSIGTHSFYAVPIFELSRQTGLRRKPKGKKISSINYSSIKQKELWQQKTTRFALRFLMLTSLR